MSGGRTTHDFVRTIPRVELVRVGVPQPITGQTVRLGARAVQAGGAGDFTGVELVGQGFADELFRVWQADHPDVTMTITGANRGVALMIGRIAKP